MRQLKAIVLGFENCEEFRIKKNRIGDFLVEDIERSIARRAVNSISEMYIANEVAIELFPEDDNTYAPFGFEEERMDKFDRISHGDITSIDLEYTDGSADAFYVPYEEEGHGDVGLPNIHQKTHLSGTGCLYLVISKTNGIDRYFDMNKIEDVQETDYRKRMFDIGVEEEPLHFWCPDDLPEMYRYFYLIDEDGHTALAMRAGDEENGWRVVFEEQQEAVHFPAKWQYPKSTVDEALRANKYGMRANWFSPERMRDIRQCH